MLIERFGGSHGIRDIGALESALARPQIGYYRDLIEDGGALWENLLRSSPTYSGMSCRSGMRLKSRTLLVPLA